MTRNALRLPWAAFQPVTSSMIHRHKMHWGTLGALWNWRENTRIKCRGYGLGFFAGTLVTAYAAQLLTPRQIAWGAVALEEQRNFVSFENSSGTKPGFDHLQRSGVLSRRLRMGLKPELKQHQPKVLRKRFVFLCWLSVQEPPALVDPCSLAVLDSSLQGDEVISKTQPASSFWNILNRDLTRKVACQSAVSALECQGPHVLSLVLSKAALSAAGGSGGCWFSASIFQNCSAIIARRSNQLLKLFET